jgi:tRNA-splicing ligase RtcB
MKREKLLPSDFEALGIRSITLRIAIGRIAAQAFKTETSTKEKMLSMIMEVLEEPEKYSENEQWAEVSKFILENPTVLGNANELGTETLQRNSNNTLARSHLLRTEPSKYPVWGAEHIEEGAIAQMDAAVKLPISLSGALMPDAHQGYGLPIGGVLATQPNTIIPYAVGNDIACRMCLSIFDLPTTVIETDVKNLKSILVANTFFGTGAVARTKHDDSLFDSSEWYDTPLLAKLREKAYSQLGTSGSGNHFVEWGELEVTTFDNHLGVLPGRYLALLSHSGSRGLGSAIAGTYSKIAMETNVLPDIAKHLAWLDLDTENGAEYFHAMNLAGKYASANHHEIHNKIAKALGHAPIKMVENHHNYAWLETLANGEQAMVHRKGATPAGENVLGVIPGSMGTPGYVVKGLGNTESINSAAHGAGRAMSRNAANKQFTRNQMLNFLGERGISLIGAGADEAPFAYKDISTVMAAQENLVEVLAAFHPKIVRMADAKEKPED